MEDQKKLLQFVEWLGANVPELQGQAPEQIVSTINKLSESPEGQEMLQGLINEFESSMTGMFKKGGKLDYLLCLKKGGSIQDCGCGKKIEKAEDGRVLGSDQYPNVSRKEAIDAAMDMGFSRKQARNAYRNQLRGLSSINGLSGKELRQNARWNIIDTAYPRAIEAVTPNIPQLPVLDDITIDETPIEFNDTFVPIDNKVNVRKIDTFGGSFNSAFGAARRGELDKFYYNGPDKKAGWYTTKLGNNNTSETATGMTATPTYVATPVDNGKGGKKYTWRDLFRMANVNGAVNMK